MRLTSISCSLLVAASLAASACSDDPMLLPPLPDAGIDAAPPGAVDFPSIGNNSARTDTGIGSGTAENRALVKRVDYTSIGPALGIDVGLVGPVFVSRSATTSTYVNTYVQLENRGTTRRCFVRLPAMELQDENETTIATDSVSYVQGSVGVSGTVHTDTCLAPGEKAYVVGILEAPYAQVHRLSFTIDGGDEGFDEPALRVLPEAITGSVDFVDATAHNVGTGAAELGFSMWIGYDDAHQPIEFGYFDPCNAQAEPTIAAGATLPLCSTYYFDGTGATIQAWLGYRPASAAKSAAPDASQRALADVEAARARLFDRYAAARARLF
jgi:hypothetical protein